MLNLNSHAVFLEDNGHGYVYNGDDKNLLVTNLSVITILKLCNGKRNLEEVTNQFDGSVQSDVRRVIQELINLNIVVDKDTYARTPKYEENASFFLSLTHRCNLNCHFCLKYSPEKYKEIDLNQWIGIIDMIAEFNEKDKVIYLSGGEPLLFEQFGELYIYIHKKNMKINIYSNGTRFDNAVYSIFQQYPPSSVLLSLDGSSAEIHDGQRGVKGTFDKLLETSAKLLMIDKVQVFWQVVINKNNLMDMENIARLAYKTGVTNIHYGLMSEIGKGIENPAKLSNQEMLLFYEQCYAIGIKYKGILNINRPVQSEQAEHSFIDFSSCGIGNMIHVNEQGYVFPCYGWDTDKYKSGPISSMDDLKKIRIPEFFDRALTDYESCSVCGIRNICHGGCKVEIFNLTGKLHGCNVAKKEALERFMLNHIKTR